MPLHLLGKKSWNVYNTDNISRVRHDEAAFEASEALRRKRRETHDAAARLAILRGETPPPSPPASPVEDHHPATSTASDRRKRRRLAGEDDTDRDIRLARSETRRRSPSPRKHIQSKVSLPLTDGKGNIQLFTEVKSAPAPVSQQQNEEGMRFCDAAGYGKGQQRPWYASHSDGQVAVGRDAFGHEDGRRGERDARRTAGADPLAAMRRAQGELRAVKEEREERRRKGDEDGLDGFSLDAQSEIGRKEERRRRSRSPREEQRRRRSRSPHRRHRDVERRHRRER